MSPPRPAPSRREAAGARAASQLLQHKQGQAWGLGINKLKKYINTDVKKKTKNQQRERKPPPPKITVSKNRELWGLGLDAAHSCVCPVHYQCECHMQGGWQRGHARGPGALLCPPMELGGRAGAAQGCPISVQCKGTPAVQGRVQLPLSPPEAGGASLRAESQLPR